jgi:hypothetical protein
MSSPKLSIDGPNDDKHIPNFAPWSQETFLARLKTFHKVSYWHPKPELIGEVHWAKRGWSCVDVNTVACKGGCERRVVVKLDTMGTVVKKALASEAADADNEDDEEEVDETELEKALAERYQNEIVNGGKLRAKTTYTGCHWCGQLFGSHKYARPTHRCSAWRILSRTSR